MGGRAYEVANGGSGATNEGSAVVAESEALVRRFGRVPIEWEVARVLQVSNIDLDQAVAGVWPPPWASVHQCPDGSASRTRLRHAAAECELLDLLPIPHRHQRDPNLVRG